MTIRVACPRCEGSLEAETSLAGGQAPCPRCGHSVGIPPFRVGPGVTLGGFRLDGRLGRGGMGEVFLATQISMDRQVALKILPPDFARDQAAVGRFLHEVRTAARLNHPSIVTAHEAGQDSGVYFLAMAYVDGETLDARLARDRCFPEAEALRTTRTVAEALAYAWKEHRILHRDIKPANIMVDRRGRVLLMDLGLAKRQGEDSGLTISGTILGTPHYMSPEQASGRVSDLTIQTDMYSLGATLHHMVTGEVPFPGDSALHVLHRHVHDHLPPLQVRYPGLSAGCCRLVHALLAKTPGERPADWDAVIADIDRVLAGGAPAIVAADAKPSQSLAAGHGAPAHPRLGGPGPARQTRAAAMRPGTALARRPGRPGGLLRRRRSVLVALAVAVLTGLAALFPVARWSQGEGAPERRQPTREPTTERPLHTPSAVASGDAAGQPATMAPGPAIPAPAAGLVSSTGAAGTGQALDLLALTDPVADRVFTRVSGANVWRREGDALVYESDGKGGKVAPPVAVHARSYEIEIGFERLSGSGRLHIDLPLGDGIPTIIPVYVDSPGFKLLNNRTGPTWPADKGGTGTAVVRIERPAGDRQHRITMRFNNETLLDWTGDTAQIGRPGEPHPLLPGQPITSVWCHSDSYAIRRWVLRVLEEEARTLR